MSEQHKAKTLEMIAVMQAYVDGKPIESSYDGGSFSPLTEPVWNWHMSKYRIATIPDSINWDHVSPEWKYMARDLDGSVWFFIVEPEKRQGFWESGGDNDLVKSFASYVRGTVDWKDSLVKRPD